MIYLDHAATAPPRREVLEAMWPWLTRDFANPASHHEPGLVAHRALEDAREEVAFLLGAHPSEILFTSGGTEADNAALKGLVWAAGGPRHVVISAIEHPAVLESAAWLERQGHSVTRLGVDADGLVDPADLEAALRPDTAVVSIQYANNEVGTIQPLLKLVPIVTDRHVAFHTDAVQAAGWLPLAGLGVQALSLAGHKIGTPKGMGVLFVSGRVPFEPLVHGGGQQGDRRSGTESVAAAVGLATALRLASAAIDEHAWHVERLRDDFIERVEALGARLTGHRTHRLPGQASFVLPGRSGESVLVDLDARGIVCSSGSACAAGSDEPSHVLTAMGFDRQTAQTAVRFTFGVDTSAEDLDHTVATLSTILGR